VDTLAHCGLTSPMRQSLKLPGHHIGLGCPGVSGCSPGLRPAWQLGQPPEGTTSGPLAVSCAPLELCGPQLPASRENTLPPGHELAKLPHQCAVVSHLRQDKRGHQKSLSTWYKVQDTQSHSRSATPDGQQANRASRATKERGRPSSVSECQLAW
jgi:hypothetical protein